MNSFQMPTEQAKPAILGIGYVEGRNAQYFCYFPPGMECEGDTFENFIPALGRALSNNEDRKFGLPSSRETGFHPAEYKAISRQVLIHNQNVAPIQAAATA